MSPVNLGLPKRPPFAPEHPGNLRHGTQSFTTAAKSGLNNATQRRNLTHATTTIRAKRDGVVAEMEDWQQLRDRKSVV